MNRRRLVAALFFSAVVLATLGVIVYAERASADQTLTVWVLARDVAAGAPFSAGDVEQVRIASPNGTYNYEQRSPAQVAARYARSLQAHDILRSDDLVPAVAVAEIVLSVQNPPPLAQGDSIDIFATMQGARQARIGHNITVISVSGTSIDVLVPAGDEAAWVAVGSSTTALHAARTAAGSDYRAEPISANDGIGILCGGSCASTASPLPSNQP